jgi:uncharacterized phage-associated protein
MNAHSSIKIASRLLELGNEQDNAITPMQIIKLTYLCHGWMLGLYSRPLIRENIEAWRYGPVIPQLYEQVREYRSFPVETLPETPGEGELDESQNDIIKQVYDAYGHFTGIQLSTLTHASGTPWHKTWDDGKGQNSVISNDLIEDHFASLAREQ